MPPKSVSGSSRSVQVSSTSSSAAAAAELRSKNAAERNRIDKENEDLAEARERASSFKQQQLSSWQPTLVPGVASPTLFLIAILCIPIGIALCHFSNEIQEIALDYTDCNSTKNGTPCSKLMGKDGPDPNKICECNVPFSLESDFKGTVWMYYALTNFFQNHRRYVRSRDDRQLLGVTMKSSDPLQACKPFDRQNEKVYWPCGANARSMFQDEIQLYYKHSSTNSTIVSLSGEGVAWYSDKHYKFRNPENWSTAEFKKNYTPPTTWIKTPPGGLQNEDLMVWMRTSAFPNFRKLYRTVNKKGNFKDGLPKGDYFLKINYTFPVTAFKGTKSIVLSTTSFLGAKNPFLGTLFIVVGTFCLCMSFFFFGVRLLERRSPNLARVGVAVPDDWVSPFRCPSVQI